MCELRGVNPENFTFGSTADPRTLGLRRLLQASRDLTVCPKAATAAKAMAVTVVAHLAQGADGASIDQGAKSPVFYAYIITALVSLIKGM